MSLRSVHVAVVSRGCRPALRCAQFPDRSGPVVQDRQGLRVPWASTRSPATTRATRASRAGTPPRGRRADLRHLESGRPRPDQELSSATALQADPIVWDRNGNGVPDLLMLAVDRTMEGPECGAPRSSPAARGRGSLRRRTRHGWEGVRIFEMSDDPANPFATVTQVKPVTPTAARTRSRRGRARSRNQQAARLRLLVSAAGGTDVRSRRARPQATVPEHDQPVRRGPGEPQQPAARGDPGDRGAAEQPGGVPTELAVQPKISYPGDPDGKTGLVRAGLQRARRLSPPRGGGGRLPRHRHPRRAPHGRRGLRGAGPGVGGRPTRHPEHGAPDARRRRRGQLGRQRPDSRGRSTSSTR